MFIGSGISPSSGSYVSTTLCFFLDMFNFSRNNIFYTSSRNHHYHILSENWAHFGGIYQYDLIKSTFKSSATKTSQMLQFQGIFSLEISQCVCEKSLESFVTCTCLVVTEWSSAARLSPFWTKMSYKNIDIFFHDFFPFLCRFLQNHSRKSDYKLLIV